MGRLGFLPAEDLVEYLFNIRATSGISVAFDRAGYDSDNVVRLLSFFFVALVLLLLLILVVWMCSCTSVCSNNKHLTRRFACAGINRLMLVGSIELMLCPTLICLSGSHPGHYYILPGLCIVSMIVLMAVLSAVLVCLPKHFDNPSLSTRFGVFFKGFRKQALKGMNWMTICYYLLFMLKRLFFVIILVGMRDKPANQIECLLYLSTVYLIYIGYYRPFLDPYHNWVEIVDELILISILVLLL